MADLPRIPRRLVTTEAPRSRVSASDVASPFRAMSDALGEFAPGVRTFEQEAGEQAAVEKAVATGPDGEPRLEVLPAFGDYAAGYNRAARLRYFAELAPRVETEVQKAQIENAANPEAFRAWARTYVRDLAGRERDPKARLAVEKLAGDAAEQAYRGLAADHFKRTVAGAKTALEARRVTLENRLGALAREGGTGTPEYQSAMADYDAIGEEFVKNPLFAEDRAEVAFKRDRMMSRHNALAVVGLVRRTAEDSRVDGKGEPLGGAKKAKELADSILTDESLNLTNEERRSYHAQAIAEIRQLNSANRALVSQLSSEGSAWVRAIESGEYDRDSVQDFLDRAAEAGAVKAVESVTKAVSRQAYLHGWFDKLPAGERARAVIELQGRGGPSLVDRIEQVESGGNPAAVNPNSTAAGPGQFIASTWLDMVKRHAPEVAAGRSDQEILALRTDPQFRDLNRKMIGKYAEENGNFLAAQGVPVNDGTLYLAHFTGPAGASALYKADPNASAREVLDSVRPGWRDKNGRSFGEAVIASNRGVLGQSPTAGQFVEAVTRTVGKAAVPAAVRGDPAFYNAVRKRAAEDLSRTLPKIEARVKAGERVDAGELNDLGMLVYAVGSDEQKKRVVEMAVLASAGERLAGMSAQEREAAGAEFAQKFAQGSTQLESEIGSYVSDFSKKIAKAYKDDPYDAAVRYGGRKATPAVDLSDPAAMDAALKAREAERRFIREHEGIDPGTLLRPAEAGALRTALTGSDPALVARAAGVASNLLASNADAFDGIGGKSEIEKTALTFRHYVDDLGMTAADAANRIVRERAPEHKTQAAARVKGEDVNEIVKKQVSLSDLQKTFDSSWWPGKPEIGFTPESRAGMYGDYVELFREFYGETGDVGTARTLAQDQLKRVWGTTSISGTETVMRYPPERIPALQGVENAGEVVAQQALASILAETGQMVERGSLRILPVPGHTAAAFKSGRPVPYMLGWADEQGLLHWLPPGKAFVVDAEGARQAQSERRETELRRRRAAFDLPAAQEKPRQDYGTPYFGTPLEAPAPLPPAPPYRRPEPLPEPTRKALVPIEEVLNRPRGR